MKKTKYKRLYKKVLEENKLLRELLATKTEQFKIANKQADCLAKELLSRIVN